jgi:NADPH-dependent FMN reductase
MTTKPRIAIVIGSTRPGRYADKAAGWMLKQTEARDDIEAELLDLRDHPLPFFDEKGPPMSTPSENPEALRWQKTLARYDGPAARRWALRSGTGRCPASSVAPFRPAAMQRQATPGHVPHYLPDVPRQVSTFGSG